MSNYVLDKTYSVAEATGIPAHRVVVIDAAENACKLPTAANASGILGVSVAGQDRQGAGLTVRKLGIALVEASGAIARGDLVNIAGTSGRVKTVSEAPGADVFYLGVAETASQQAGDLIEVFLLPFLGNPPQ